jgi:UDP-N-acetylglucosamine:LPS N-acetylglucosamine transferase
MTLPSQRHATDRSEDPLRVLLVSADIGHGHDSGADALEEQLRRARPDVVVERVDSFVAMRRGSGRFFRFWYAVGVRWLPLLHELWFHSVRHVPAVRWFYAEVIGRWCGRALAARVRAADVVVSTYPMGTAGVAWLRRRGWSDVPLVAVVTDFAPHPFWAYGGVDRYAVPSDRGAEALRPFAGDADVLVGRLPVTSGFTTPARTTSRTPGRPLRVLVTSGSLGLGEVEQAVEATLAVDAPTCAVVVCGHNDALRDRLLARGDPADRLEVHGWVDDMEGLLGTVDVVVNDAGGVSALEALVTGRALVMFRPIAGHGRENARLLAEEGLAAVCHDAAALTTHLTELARSADLLHLAQRRARAFALDPARLDLPDVLEPLLDRPDAGRGLDEHGG